MQRRTTVVEHRQDSTKLNTSPFWEKYRQKDNENHQKNILTRPSTVRERTDTIHACSNLNQYYSTNVDKKNDQVPQQKDIIPSDDPT